MPVQWTKPESRRLHLWNPDSSLILPKTMERRASADSVDLRIDFWHIQKTRQRHVQFGSFGKLESEKENQYDVCHLFFSRSNLSASFLDASTLWVSLKKANDCKEVLVLDRCTQLVSLLGASKRVIIGVRRCSFPEM